MPLRKAALVTTALVLTACAAVTPREHSETVTLVEPEHVRDCTKLATTDVSVTQQVGIYTRSDDTVEKDLVTLGKNRAAELGGDSIVAKGPAEDGKMSFDIYKCGD